MAEDDDFPLGPEEEQGDPEAFEVGRALVLERCKAAGIKAQETEGFLEDGSVWLEVQMPSGRDTTRLLLTDQSETDALLSIEFERYQLLGDYVGICSYSDGVIEAGIRHAVPLSSPALLRRRLFANVGPSSSDIEPIVLKQGEARSALTISLGTPSRELQVFNNLCVGPRGHFSVRIENSKAKTHDKALQILERLANALFFQIELKMGITVGLNRGRQHRFRDQRERAAGKRDDLVFPVREYDSQSMSLYWYAKSAKGMPLLQYLAYYQVLEFYMPTYSNHDAIAKVRNILKDPRFTPDKDSQVAKILTTLRPSARGFGDERSQLEAVLRRCVSAEQLRDFFTSVKGRAEFYTDEFRKVASQKIPLRSEASDLLTETAHRLYEIRCRIVHTKDHGDREIQPLLPYSKEASHLHEDIALIEFAATAALVASSVAVTES